MSRPARLHGIVILAALVGLVAIWAVRKTTHPSPAPVNGPSEPAAPGSGPAIVPSTPLPPAPPAGVPKGSLRVVLREGTKPVPGVNFTMIDEATHHLEVCKSGENGACMIKGLPGGQYHITLTHPDFVFAAAHPQLEEGESKEIVINLDRGARVEGRVTDARGQPLKGTNVRIATAQKGRPVDNVREAHTDDEGHYQVVSIPLGSFQVIIQHAGFRAFRKPDLFVSRAGEEFRVDAVLLEGRTLAGHILTEERKPIAGALVAGSNEETATCESGADGAFLLSGLGDSPVRCFASAPGYGYTMLPAVAPDSTGVELVMSKAATVSGTIESQPLPPQWTVTISRFIPAQGVYLRLYSQVLRGTEFRFTEVPPGRYRLEVTAEGFESIPLPDMEVSAGQAVAGVQIHLRKSS